MQLLQHQLSETSLAQVPDLDETKISHEMVFAQWIDSLSNNSDELNNLFEAKIVQKVKETHNARSLMQLADLHTAKGSFRIANKYYLQALRKTNNSSHVLRKLVSLSIKWGKRVSADKYFNQLLAKSDNLKDIEEYLVFLFEGGDDVILQNISTFKKYAELYPDELELHNMYGLACIRLGRLDVAKEQFKTALKTDPHYIHGLNNSGVVYQASGDFEQASKFFKSAIGVDGRFTHAYQNLASSHLIVKEYEKALDILKQAYELKLPLDDMWLASLAQLLIDHSEDYDLAFEIHSNLLREHPDNALYLNNQGVTYHRKGDPKKAIKFYGMATRSLERQNVKRPSREIHGVIFGNLMESYYKSGRQSDAEDVADKLLRMFPDHLNALRLKMRRLIDDHKFQEAKQLSIAAHELYKDDPEIIVNLSYLYSITDLNNEAALDILKPAVVNNNPNTYIGQLILNNYIFSLLQLGGYDEANELIDALSDSPFTYATKALFMLSQDKPKAARSLYSKAFDNIEDKFNLEINQLFSYYEFAKYYISKNDLAAANAEITKAKEIKIHNLMSKRIKDLVYSVKSPAV